MCIVVVSALAPSLFPWRLASTQIGWLPWVQVAELGGEPLIDLITATFSCAVGAWLLDRRRAPLVTCVALCVVTLGYGELRLHQIRFDRTNAPSVRIGAVQPNINQHDKHDITLWPSHLTLMRHMTFELEQAGASLVVWPESAYPYTLARDRPHDALGWAAIRREGVTGPVLFGAITERSRLERWNSAILMDRSGRWTGVSDKSELIPFGEHVPLCESLPPLRERFPSCGFRRSDRAVLLSHGRARIAVLNCYEDVLPHHCRTMASLGPNLLVNITNDAWFGDSSEPYLHQHVARVRAIETRRDLLRVVNTGVSGHVTATGETAISTRSWTRDSFIADVRLLEGTTPWVRFGDWLTPCLFGAMLATVMVRRRDLRGFSTRSPRSILPWYWSP